MGKKELTWEEKRKAQLVREAKARQVEYVPPNVLEEALPYQLDFIRDPAPWKAVCSERRGGKTSALVLALVDVCLRLPNARCTYFSISNETCRRIVEPIFWMIANKYNLQARFTSKYEIRFDNGSVIHLIGVNSSPEDMNKARGTASDLTVIDECQDFDQDLRQLIHGVLKMTLAQRRTPLILAGTPGNKQGKHYWWLVNKPDSQEKEFKRFKFHWKDNTKVDDKSGLRICDAIQAEVDADILTNPLVVHTPEFRQEIMGEWVTTTSARIYRYEPTFNDITSLPPPAFFQGAMYNLGFDLGYHPDPTALVIGAFNPAFDNNLYILLAEEHHQMVTEDLAKRIKELDAKYKFQSIVGDSANLNVIADLNRTYGIGTIKAHKLGKEGHQNTMNSDFIKGYIKLYRPETEKLSDQLLTTIWTRDSILLGDKKVEDPRFDNHCTDALLYLHFHSRHYWYEVPKAKWNLVMSNQEHYQRLTEKMIEMNHDSYFSIDFAEPNRNK